MARTSKKRRVENIRRGLKWLLGARCAGCGDRKLSRLTIDHVDACTWIHEKHNTYDRWYRYLREYKQGVRLRLLCHSCNSAENQSVHGTHEERRTKNVTSLRSMKARQESLC
jgi:hypothetical protein